MSKRPGAKTRDVEERSSSIMTWLERTVAKAWFAWPLGVVFRQVHRSNETSCRRVEQGIVRIASIVLDFVASLLGPIIQGMIDRCLVIDSVELVLQ